MYKKQKRYSGAYQVQYCLYQLLFTTSRSKITIANFSVKLLSVTITFATWSVSVLNLKWVYKNPVLNVTFRTFLLRMIENAMTADYGKCDGGKKLDWPVVVTNDAVIWLFYKRIYKYV